MTEQKKTGTGWRPRRSFTNTDPRAVELVEFLHQSRNPHLTILFGSRARGDYAEGRSDVDILLVEDPLPSGEEAEESEMALRKAKAGLYRGQKIEANWLLRTLEEFRSDTRCVGNLEAKALNDGYVLGDDAEFYITLARIRETKSHIRRANWHAGFLEDCGGSGNDECTRATKPTWQ